MLRNCLETSRGLSPGLWAVGYFRGSGNHTPVTRSAASPAQQFVRSLQRVVPEPLALHVRALFFYLLEVHKENLILPPKKMQTQFFGGTAMFEIKTKP